MENLPIINAINYISKKLSSILKKADKYNYIVLDYTDELNKTLASNAGEIYVIKKV